MKLSSFVQLEKCLILTVSSIDSVSRNLQIPFMWRNLTIESKQLLKRETWVAHMFILDQTMVFMVPCQWFLWYHVNGSHLKESEDCTALIKKNVQNIGK